MNHFDYAGTRFRRRTVIHDGPAGTRQTLDAMAELARAGRRDPLIRKTSFNLLRGVAPKDWDGELMRLHRFVQSQIRYTRDPVDTLSSARVRGVEYLATPRATLQSQAGDCDESATLLSSLLGAVGHPTRFVAVGLNGRPFSHVYLETPTSKGTWLSAETTEPVDIGWTPRNVTSRLIRYAD